MKYRLTETDSTAVYSRSPSRPFRYGFAYNKEQCVDHFNNRTQLYDFHEGDVIADVGAASGWIDGGYSVICDSITFWVQDIDTDFLNKEQFNKVVTHFNTVRGTPQTNVLHYVLGTYFKTNLPNNTFDKIIIYNALHEIDFPSAILEDLTIKLKPNGILIIADHFSSPKCKRRGIGCNMKLKTLKWLNKIAERNGFYLYNRKAPGFAYFNVLYYSTNSQTRAHIFDTISSLYDKLIERLESRPENDSAYINRVFSLLERDSFRLAKTYPYLDDYLSDITKQNIDKYSTYNAYEISLKGLRLFPNSESLLAAHARASEQYGYLTRALEYFDKATKSNRIPDDYSKDINRIKEKLSSDSPPVFVPQ